MLSRDMAVGQPTAARGSRTWWLLGLVAQREWRVSQLLLGLEVRQLLASRALWAMVGMSAVLTVFNFSQAVAQYSRGGTDPLQGIVVPTFGAIYLVNTFLLPFVAIRVIGNDARHGGLKLLLQLPVGAARLVAIKLCALAVGWSIAVAPALGALTVWLGLGGHLAWSEVATVLLGHALYALVIVGVAFLAGAVSESSATAAIVSLSFTLGSWSLELAATSSTAALVRGIGSFSLLPALRSMEGGLLGSPNALTLLVLGLGFVALSVVWLPAGRSWRKKLVRSGAVVGVAAQAVLLVIQLPVYVDVTENHRNSQAHAGATLTGYPLQPDAAQLLAKLPLPIVGLALIGVGLAVRRLSLRQIQNDGYPDRRPGRP